MPFIANVKGVICGLSNKDGCQDLLSAGVAIARHDRRAYIKAGSEALLVLLMRVGLTRSVGLCA